MSAATASARVVVNPSGKPNGSAALTGEGVGKTPALAVFLCIVCLMMTAPVYAQAQSIPESAAISGMAGYPQRFTLSCESRSAVDWAGFWGVGIREKRFLNELPRSDNPDAGFVGNPNGEWGNLPPDSYGVHAEPVAALLRQYGLQAEARRGMSWDELRLEIAAGRPVIVWVIGQMWRGSSVRYKAEDGSKSVVARFEHTMILTGYDRRSVTVVDAFSGRRQKYPLRDFIASWETLERMAITGNGAAAPPSAETPVPTPLPASFSHHQYLPLVFGPGRAEPDAPAPMADTYKVKRGDYLRDVARRFGLDWRKLADLNGLQPPYILYTGQMLRLR